VRLLDVGCGAGLRRRLWLGRVRTCWGIDAAEDVIRVAQEHAGDLWAGVRVAVAEDLLAEGMRFPVITALEVVEHVPDPAAFIRVLVGLLERAGCSSCRRSIGPAAHFCRETGAEYVLRLLPVGTHDWRKFIAPRNCGDGARGGSSSNGQAPACRRGLNGWRMTRDLGVDYLMAAEG